MTEIILYQVRLPRALLGLMAGAVLVFQENAIAKIKADLDRDYLSAPLPAEPVTYGDPSPSKRSSAMADLWRAQQDATGRLSAIAEAATLCWVVTGEEKYFAKAREILLGKAAGGMAAPIAAVPAKTANIIEIGEGRQRGLRPGRRHRARGR